MEEVLNSLKASSFVDQGNFFFQKYGSTGHGAVSAEKR